METEEAAREAQEACVEAARPAAMEVWAMVAIPVVESLDKAAAGHAEVAAVDMAQEVERVKLGRAVMG